MPLLLERVILPTVVVVFYRIGGGAAWMQMVGKMQLLVPIVFFCSVLGPLQSVQRAELLFSLCMQANDGTSWG